MSTIPATIRAGDTTVWRDPAASDAIGNTIDSSWTLTYYLRNAAGGGLTIVGSAYGTGWENTISATASAGLAVGTWFFQARATKAAEAHTLWSGQVQVLAALNYTGTPAAFDGRSQASQDLDAVQAAIRALISGGAVKKYTIGSRSLEKFTLAELIERENLLKAQVAKEQAAERIANGLGDPRNLFVRFG